jgi:uncharacterized phage-like protein YoqJ
MIETTCCFTGYRPEKLPWGLDEHNPNCRKLKEVLYREKQRLIIGHGVTRFISGMARGIETYAAEIVLALKEIHPVTLECAIPYEEQAAGWRSMDRERYFSIVAKADRETLISHKFSYESLEIRNRYMVDQSGFVIAVWGGGRGGTGGTGNTLHYAEKKGRFVVCIDPSTQTVTYLDGKTQ